MECASIAETRFGKNAIFFTGTIPGSGWRIAAVIAAYSGKIINRVKQWFRDNLRDTYSFFSVWEWQKRGMLHLHLCVASNETSKLESLRLQLARRWITLLQDISWDAKVDVFRKNASWTWQDNLEMVQTQAIWVEKSIARYLSKYSAKATKTQTKPTFFCPSRWWSTDRATAQEADRRRAVHVLGGFAGVVGTAILQSLATVFEALQARIKQFRNFIYVSYGGINLFETMPETKKIVEDFLTDNVGNYVLQED
jgi:hypothetical protein